MSSIPTQRQPAVPEVTQCQTNKTKACTCCPLSKVGSSLLPVRHSDSWSGLNCPHKASQGHLHAEGPRPSILTSLGALFKCHSQFSLLCPQDPNLL